MSRKLPKLASLIAASVLAATGLAAVSIQPAAASASDHGTYPNVWPHYCNRNAALIATRPVEDELGRTVSQVQVFYSYSCQTNWIRVTSNPAGGLTAKDLSADGQPGIGREKDYGTASSYTRQVYAPGATCIHFQVHLYYPNGRSYGETYSAGANRQTIC